MNANKQHQQGSVIIKSLQNNKTLTKLDLSYNNKLSTQFFNSLSKLFQLNRSSLIELDLRSVKLSDKQGAIIIKSLQYNKTLTKLNLSGNYQLSTQFLNSLSKLFQLNRSSLKELILYFIKLTDKNGAMIIKSLETNQNLTKLDLSYNKHLSTQFSNSLSKLFQLNQSSLKELILNDIKLTDKNGAIIIKSLRNNKSLTKLDISWNRQLSTQFSNSLSKLFQFDQLQSSLKELILYDIKLTDKNGAIIIKSLHNNKSLTKLDLSYNDQLSTQFSNSLSKLFQLNRSSLKELDLDFIEIVLIMN